MNTLILNTSTDDDSKTVSDEAGAVTGGWTLKYSTQMSTMRKYLISAQFDLQALLKL